MRFAFIKENEEAFEVTAMCETFEVSRSGYYSWKKRPASETSQRTESLTAEIANIHIKRKEVFSLSKAMSHSALQDDGAKENQPLHGHGMARRACIQSCLIVVAVAA